MLQCEIIKHGTNQETAISAVFMTFLEFQLTIQNEPKIYTSLRLFNEHIIILYNEISSQNVSLYFESLKRKVNPKFTLQSNSFKTINLWKEKYRLTNILLQIPQKAKKSRMFHSSGTSTNAAYSSVSGVLKPLMVSSRSIREPKCSWNWFTFRPEDFAGRLLAGQIGGKLLREEGLSLRGKSLRERWLLRSCFIGVEKISSIAGGTPRV
ncbi:Hypothetical_protein [Hexamita inflata]|uniref:Hypothetical_protein n=1 Tax=Hexamita inflata TaxID=28002 RepID=A0ABP1HT88_9EUKA